MLHCVKRILVKARSSVLPLLCVLSSIGETRARLLEKVHSTNSSPNLVAGTLVTHKGCLTLKSPAIKVFSGGRHFFKITIVVPPSTFCSGLKTLKFVAGGVTPVIYTQQISAMSEGRIDVAFKLHPFLVYIKARGRAPKESKGLKVSKSGFCFVIFFSKFGRIHGSCRIMMSSDSLLARARVRS